MLDHDSFVVVDERPDAQFFSSRCVQLYGNASEAPERSPTVLSPPSARVVAIVDRTADIKGAASSILRARFSFQGQSPLAPDLILVNEFRVKVFCNAIAQQTTRYFAEQVVMNGTDSSSVRKARTGRMTQSELEQAGATVLISGSGGTVAQVNDRDSSLLRRKIAEPLVLIHPISSLDDAIDYANSTSSLTSSDEPLLAAYFFAAPGYSKYLGQFLNANVACTNKIPIELLVGPPTPAGFPASLTTPYTKAMFSIPSPQYIEFGSDESDKLAQILDHNDVKAARELREVAQSTLTSVKQPPGHTVAFFEQGLITSASLILATLVTSGVIVGRYALPYILKRVR